MLEGAETIGRQPRSLHRVLSVDCNADNPNSWREQPHFQAYRPLRKNCSESSSICTVSSPSTGDPWTATRAFMGSTSKAGTDQLVNVEAEACVQGPALALSRYNCEPRRFEREVCKRLFTAPSGRSARAGHLPPLSQDYGMDPMNLMTRAHILMWNATGMLRRHVAGQHHRPGALAFCSSLPAWPGSRLSVSLTQRE